MTVYFFSRIINQLKMKRALLQRRLSLPPSIQECAPALDHFQVGTGNELHVNMADPLITT